MFFNSCGYRSNFVSNGYQPTYYRSYSQPTSFGYSSAVMPTYNTSYSSSTGAYGQPQSLFSPLGSGFQQLINQSFRISMMQMQLNMLNSFTQALRGNNANSSSKISEDEKEQKTDIATGKA